jgi:acetyltransferase-like isoleucine patch superfamily enzyme
LANLIKVLFPTIRRAASPRLRWDALQKTGIVSVGRHSYGAPNVYVWDDKTKLTIGNFCSIAEGVTFLLGGEHRMDWITTYPFSAMSNTWAGAELLLGHPATKGDIVIGNDVWIGHGALILSGVHIGNGAVIGAGSVVNKNVEDFAIVAGNPAKFIRYRFDEKTRNELKDISWWDWSDEKISKNLQMLLSPPRNF